MSEDNWDLGMANAKFVALSEPFFKLQIWTLHEGICLFCKLDPVKKDPPVGRMPQDPDCSTTRIYKICLEAINHHKGISENFYKSPALEPLDENPQKNDATDIQVNPRVFISWILKKWPEGSDHMKLAEIEYQLRKAAKKEQDKITGKIVWDKSGKKSIPQWIETKKTFFQMVKDNKLDLQNNNGSVSYWAKEVVNLLSLTVANPYEPNAIRLKIREWIDEYQSDD